MKAFVHQILLRQLFKLLHAMEPLQRRPLSQYAANENNSDVPSPFFDRSTYEYVLRMIDDLSLKSDTLGVPALRYWDARRATITLSYMRHFGLARGVVIEIGSPRYLMSRVIWSVFSDVAPIFTSNDLRFEPIPVADNTADAVLCLEVIEHLSDWPYREATTLNGLFFFLEEVWRVLKPGGRALFSTPNAASMWTITRALMGEPPMLYEWHFREYTVSEIRQIMEYVGFRILTLRTEYVWHLWDFNWLVQFMKKNGFDPEMRGDDIFVVVIKPPMRMRVPHKLRLPIGSLE